MGGVNPTAIRGQMPGTHCAAQIGADIAFVGE